MAAPPVLSRLADVKAHHITAGDTVKLAVLAGPAGGSATTVVFEVWDPAGAQPPNSHANSSETFVVLAGRGRAFSDEHEVDLAAGDTLTLMPGSTHRIVNTSATDRLYAITIMQNDDGFADMINNGPAATLDDADLAILAKVFA
jgi:mannose-6-phosphate isomerase-like protein (cupin superfamily)